WEQVDWSLFWGVFTETDRFHHFHWGRRGEPWVDEILDRLYGAIDAHLADVAARLHDGDALFVVSDHGFAPIRAEVHLNRWLAGGRIRPQGPGRCRSGLRPLRAGGDAQLPRRRVHRQGGRPARPGPPRGRRRLRPRPSRRLPGRSRRRPRPRPGMTERERPTV